MTRDASGWVEEMLGSLRQATADPGSSEITYSTTLGRRARAGSWEDQSVSTVVRIRELAEEGRFEEAAQMVDFFEDEAEVIYALFRQMIPDTNQFLLDRGMSRAELTALNGDLMALLTLPDGRSFHSRQQWEEFRSTKVELIRLCGKEEPEPIVRLLETFRETWRLIQDRDVDHLYGLLNEAVRRFGEKALADIWDHILGPLFEMRYAKFDIRNLPWSESLQTNLYVAFESMRGHLVGPERLGDIEYEEDEEKFTFRFDPCGSGGRILRGDTVEGTPARTSEPYGWGVVQGEHDFAWNKRGVCYYCTHCCVVMQQKPIEAFGYPVRVVEPPIYPDKTDAKCTWHVYKDPLKVPERFYEEVGVDKASILRDKGLLVDFAEEDGESGDRQS